MEIKDLVFICLISLFSTFTSFIWGIHEEVTHEYKKYGFKMSVASFLIFLFSLTYILHSILNGTIY